jgi:diguanylate cyclase (GGDEF)-like protein
LVFRTRLGSASAQERPPRLVLKFAVLTALGLAAAALAILVVVRQTSTSQAEQEAIGQARFASEAILEHELRVADLAAPMSAVRRGQLDRLFHARLLLEGIRGVTLYRDDGRSTYSSVGAATAEPVPPRYVQDALAGTVVSDVGPATNGPGQVLRTYVPVVLGAAKVKGVAVLEQDYEHIQEAARHSTFLVAGVLEALLVLLFVIFVPMLARVSSRIRRHVAELDEMASHDDVTGLRNRLGLRRAFEETLAGGSQSGALLMVDLDGFSEINDVFGPELSDALLAEAAERLRLEFDHDLLARIGEDEFGLLLPTSRRAEIAAAAERIQRSLDQPFAVGGVRLAVGTSAGAALFGEHGSDFATLLRRAGVALSIAKQEGQSSFQVYEPGHEASDVSRLTLTAELREALEAGRLLVHYQPQVDLATHTARGVEALLRWDHPDRGLLTAGAFIAQAERTGLSQDIRRLVLETSLRQWQEWSALGIDLELAVNLSTVDMLDVSLPDEIAELLHRYGVPPWNLILELTERTVIGDDRRAGQILDLISRIGVRIAIDDFGTGYSSLASLRRLPVHQIKLDGSFVAGVPGDAADEAIVRSTVRIAHAIGATVVAEGVETHDQLERVTALGCDIAQGYLIGRPAPADELTAVLQEAPNMAA